MKVMRSFSSLIFFFWIMLNRSGPVEEKLCYSEFLCCEPELCAFSGGWARHMTSAFDEF